MRSESLVLAACVLALGLGGCAMDRTQLDASVVDRLPSADDELDFWDDIATQHVVSNNDVLHGMLLVADGADASESYDQRLAAARERGWVGKHDDLPADESATMGMAAVATCDILDIQGGVTMMLTGPSQRYCTRELIFLEIIPSRSANQSLTGLEFIDLVSRIEDESPRNSMADGVVEEEG